MARRRKKKRRPKPDAEVLRHGALAEAQLGPALASAIADLVQPRTTEHLGSNARMHGSMHQWRTKPPGTLSFETCRRIGESSMINAAIHQRRRDGIRALTRRHDGRRHQPGWKVVHVRHHEPDFDANQVEGLDARIRRAERILKCPHPVFAPALDSVVIPLLDDHLSIDRAALNVVWDSTRTRPLQMVPVDGASILPVDLWADRWVKVNGERQLGIGYDPAEASSVENFDFAYRHLSERGIDISTLAYVQIGDENSMEPIAWLDQRDVILGVANPSSRLDRWGFGRSPAEASWVASAIYLFGIGYVLDFYRNGLANHIGVIEGSFRTEDLVSMVNVLRTQHSGAQNQHRIPFLPLPTGARLNVLPTRVGAQQMQFAETNHHLAMLVASFYSEDAGSLNLTQRGPGQGSALSEPSRDEEQRAKRSDGLLNNGHFICDRFLTPVVQAGDPELMCIWAGIDDEKEELEVRLRRERLDGGWISQNEARLEEGRDPWPYRWAELPKTIGQPMAQAELALEQQVAQAKLQQEMAASGLGQPTEGPGEQDGGEERPNAEPETVDDSQPSEAGDPSPTPPMPEHLRWREGEAAKAMPAGFVRIYLEG